MRLLLHVGDGVEVKRVARDRLERADAAFAQDYLLVSGSEQIFGRQQQILDLRSEPALQQHGLTHLTECFQQREILHVARADLEHIRLLRDGVDIGRIHHFRHDRQIELIADLAQCRQALGPMPLE